MSKTRLALLAAPLLLAACTQAPDGAADPSRESALGTLVVPDPSFTFETRSLVRVRLEPRAASASTPVEVRDAEGRRIFAGVVQQPLELDLRLPAGGEQAVVVVSGRGNDTLTQRLEIVGGRAVAGL
jgi:hypothetical protein